MEWLSWAKDVLIELGVKRDMLAPTFTIAVALYLLLSRRVKSIEDRVAKLETLTTDVECVESRTSDIWELVLQLRSPGASLVHAPTPLETMLLRESDRRRDLVESRRRR
jgi:hypothetical protein